MNNDRIEAVKGVSALSSSAFEQKVRAEVGLKIAEWKDKGISLEKISFAASKMIENFGFNKEQSEKIVTEILSGYHFDGSVGSLKQVKASEDSSGSGFEQNNNNSSSSDKTEFMKINNQEGFDIPVSVSFTVNKMKKLGIEGPATDIVKEMAKNKDEESQMVLQNWKEAVANYQDEVDLG
jgi:hypothetical protein